MTDYYEVSINNNIIDHIEMYFAVTYEEDHEDLPGEKYDPKKDYSPLVHLKSDVEDWLDENIDGGVRFTHGTAYFEIEDEAVAFKLRWT